MSSESDRPKSDRRESDGPEPDMSAPDQPAYDRPQYDSVADACAYTSYDGSTDVDYDETASVDGSVPATGRHATGFERRVWQALYAIEDPEMPVSIVDLGLIYGVGVDCQDTEESDADETSVQIEMTLTYTGCPARDMLLGEVKRSVGEIDGVDEVDLRLVWSPGWTVDMVTPEGREALREFGLSV